MYYDQNNLLHIVNKCNYILNIHLTVQINYIYNLIPRLILFSYFLRNYCLMLQTISNRYDTSKIKLRMKLIKTVN
jgi:hypothetical protein